ncbi:MAG: hypothetical protein ACI8S6_001699 [Myxococcota bacterium]|jgi:hypothetical protein
MGLTEMLSRWTAPAPSERLGWLRALLGAWTVGYIVYRRAEWSRIARTDPERFDPVGVATLLSGPLSPQLHDGLVWALLVGAVLLTLGVAHRVLAPLTAALLLFVITYRNSWGVLLHTDNLLCLHALVLAAVPASRAVSVDAWWARRRGHETAAAEDPDAGWAVRLISLVTALTYCIAGIAKVTRDSLSSWMTGANLRDQVFYDALGRDLLSGDTFSWLPELYGATALFAPAAILTIVLELLAPLFLLSRRLAIAWALLVIGMHWGIYVLMEIRFWYPLTGAAFLSLLPLERLSRARRS